MHWNFVDPAVNSILYAELGSILEVTKELVDRDKNGECEIVVCYITKKNVFITDYMSTPLSEDCKYCQQFMKLREICDRKKHVAVAVVIDSSHVFYRTLNFPLILEIEQDKNKNLKDLDYGKYMDLIRMMSPVKFLRTIRCINSMEQLRLNCKIVLGDEYNNDTPLYMRIFNAKDDLDNLKQKEGVFDKKFLEVAAEKFEKKLVGGAAFADSTGSVHSSCTYIIKGKEKIMEVAFLITQNEHTITTGYQRLCNFLIKRAKEMKCQSMVAFMKPSFQNFYFWRKMGFSLKIDDPFVDLLLDAIIEIYKLGFSEVNFHISPAYIDLIGSKSVNFDGKRVAMYMKI